MRTLSFEETREQLDELIKKIPAYPYNVMLQIIRSTEEIDDVEKLFSCLRVFEGYRLWRKGQMEIP
jgi:hypothetical protein